MRETDATQQQAAPSQLREAVSVFFHRQDLILRERDYDTGLDAYVQPCLYLVVDNHTQEILAWRQAPTLHPRYAKLIIGQLLRRHGIPKRIELPFHSVFLFGGIGEAPDLFPLPWEDCHPGRSVDLEWHLLWRINEDWVSWLNARGGHSTATCGDRRTTDDLPTCRETAIDVPVDEEDGTMTVGGQRFWSIGLERKRGEKLTARFDPDALLDGIEVYDDRAVRIARADWIPSLQSDLDAAGVNVITDIGSRDLVVRHHANRLAKEEAIAEPKAQRPNEKDVLEAKRSLVATTRENFARQRKSSPDESDT